MKIGPFRVLEIESIKELFQSHNIEFSIAIDQEAEKQILHDFNQEATYAPRQMAGKLDLNIVYFEISVDDFECVKTHLAKYGFANLSDGTFELADE